MSDPSSARSAAAALTPAQVEQVRQALVGDRGIHLDRLAWLDIHGRDDFEGQAAIVALRGLIVEIDAALARIEAGNFGQCVSCGRTIAPDRLAAHPHVARCAACA